MPTLGELMSGAREAADVTIRFGPQACGTLDEAAPREWLVADGVGGYAMGTVAGLRTRRYHGLLVVAVDGPASRMLGLVALDPVLVARRRAHPARDRRVGRAGRSTRAATSCSSRSTSTDGVPRWRWQVGGIVLEREIAMRARLADGRRRPPARRAPTGRCGSS